MTSPKMTKILLVDQSPNSRLRLSEVLAADPQMRIMGIAIDERSCFETLASIDPDIILLDADTSKLIGGQLVKKLVRLTKVPIILLSPVDQISSARACFHALTSGAMAILSKPENPGDLYYPRDCASLLETLKSLANGAWVGTPSPCDTQESSSQGSFAHKEYRAIGVGGSLGAPAVLQTILSSLVSTLPVPIFIVQHILPGYIEGMLEWLNTTSALHVKSAENGEIALPGIAYVAPDGCHMEVLRGNEIRLDRSSSKASCQPSIAKLYGSLLRAHGPQCVGVMLTGLGSDGVQELLEMKRRGALTMVQDPKGCLAGGMVAEAIKIKAVHYVLLPSGIASTLNALWTSNLITPGGV